MAPAPGPTTQIAPVPLPQPVSGRFDIGSGLSPQPLPEGAARSVSVVGLTQSSPNPLGAYGGSPALGVRSLGARPVAEDREAADDPTTPLQRPASLDGDEDTLEERKTGRGPNGRRSSVEELPDLRDRIAKMGMADEYEAFRERYMAWRKGEAVGARGDLEFRPKEEFARSGFGYWYPSVEEWKWKRTLSYWIAVTFFEGSIFFAVSSFMYNYEDFLGRYFFAVTTGGYIAGKVLFLICTYLMCLETVNLCADSAPDGASSESAESGSSSEESCRSDAGRVAGPAHKHQKFSYWPFQFRKAVANLAEVGVGPWPYWASVMYLLGVIVFGLGLLVELIPNLPEEVASPLNKWLYLFGSMGFLVGGLAECIENETFTSLNVTKGWLGALFNTLGGTGFVVGAVYGWIDAYWSNIWYGIGSLTFVLCSSVMIIMWKDEQFGLTFLAVLNRLGGPHGRPILDSDDRPKEMHFSPCGVVFIHIYCIAGALSIYNVNLELTFAMLRNFTVWRVFQMAFQNSLPFLYSHLVLALTSAVIRMPKMAPYRQLFLVIRFLAMVVLVNSTLTFAEYMCIYIKRDPQ